MTTMYKIHFVPGNKPGGSTDAISQIQARQATGLNATGGSKSTQSREEKKASKIIDGVGIGANTHNLQGQVKLHLLNFTSIASVA